MDDGVDTTVNLVDAGECLDDLTVAGEIGADETGATVRGGTRLKLMTVHL